MRNRALGIRDEFMAPALEPPGPSNSRAWRRAAQDGAFVTEYSSREGLHSSTEQVLRASRKALSEAGYGVFQGHGESL